MPPFLQRLFRPLAIPGILRIVAGFEALVYFLLWMRGPEGAARFQDQLGLDIGAVLGGEFWRLLSFLALPAADPFSSWGLVMLLFIVIFAFFINDLIEGHWGVEGLNAYFWLCVVANILSAVLIFLFFGPTAQAAVAAGLTHQGWLSMAMLLAAGCLEPKQEIRLFAIIPVPLGVIAAISGGLTLLGLIRMPVLLPFALVAFAPFLGWVLPRVFRHAVNAAEVRERRGRFEQGKLSVDETFHRCANCGITDQDDPELEFRVTDNDEEWCLPCLDEKKRNADG